MGGLLGIGGSIIIIPGLILYLSQTRGGYSGAEQHLIQSAAMICNFFIAAPSVVVHRRANAIMRSVVIWLIPAALAGILMGVALSNPKAIVFLTALFPQFLTIDKPLAPQFFLLVGTLMVFSCGFLMGYALLAHRVRVWLIAPGREAAVRRAGGAVFIGFGLLLAVSSNR